MVLRSASFSSLWAFGLGRLRLVSRWGVLPAEDIGGLWLLSSCPVFSSSCPCLFRIKTEAQILIFWSLEHVFREAGSTINWFAYRRLERYSGGVATIRTYDFEHSFLEHVNHLYWRWAQLEMWKMEKTMLNYSCWLSLESSSWWSSFRIAISAVNRSAWVRLEWNFTIFSTISANCLMHLFLGQWLFQLLVCCCAKIASYTLQ